MLAERVKKKGEFLLWSLFSPGRKQVGGLASRQSGSNVRGCAMMSYYQKLWIDDGMKKAAYPSA